MYDRKKINDDGNDLCHDNYDGKFGNFDDNDDKKLLKKHTNIANWVKTYKYC